MPLKDTEEKLYNPKSDIEKREHSKSVFDVDDNLNNSNSDKFFARKKWWGKLQFSWNNKETKIITYIGVTILGIITFGALLTIGVHKFSQTAFSEDKTKISVTGDAFADSAQVVKYLIKYENNNRVDLKNVEIILNYPDSFYPEEINGLEKYSDRSSRIKIGVINSHSSGEIEIRGKFYAGENSIVYLRPTMKYSPNNFNSTFEVSNQIGIRIISSPIELKVEAPKESLSESSVEYKVSWKNKGDIPLNDLNLKLEYPEGFTYQGANPHPVSENQNSSLWHLGQIAPNEENFVIIEGTIKGNRYDVKNIKAIIFKNGNESKEIVYGKADGVTKIVVPPLAISHTVNGQSFLNVILGDILHYKINFSNLGDISLRDVVIKLKIDSPIIDYSKLHLKTGSFDDNSKTIIWKASDVEKLKNLEPGMSGFVELDIYLKKNLEIKTTEDKNFVIESVATIDSSDIAFDALGASKNISNKVVAKLNSQVVLNSLVYYNDSHINNSGPLPPKVGEKTQYAIHWQITNLSNDISDVTVKAFLPTGVIWKNVIYPENENITFNERTHEVVWNVGKLSAGVGVLSTPKECSFQIAIVPGVNQIGTAPSLLGKTTLTAKDNFTSAIINQTVAVKTSQISDDKSVGKNDYMVIE